MQRKRDFTAETTTGLIRGLFDKLSIKAFAEEDSTQSNEGTQGSETTATVPPINFEALISQARKEEKDKLYPRLNKAESEVKELTKSVNKYLLENAALKEELDKVKNSGEGESSVVTQLKGKITELENTIETLKSSSPNEEEIRRQISAEYEVKLYAQQQIEANKDEILSMLASGIKGSTKEEVDAAIADAKEKTLSIKKDLGLVDEEGNPVDSTSKKTSETKTKKKAPAAAPAQESEGETFDADYIRNLDPRSPEYLEFRKKMGLK